MSHVAFVPRFTSWAICLLTGELLNLKKRQSGAPTMPRVILMKMYRKNSPCLRFSMYNSLNVDNEELGKRSHSAREEGTVAWRYRRGGQGRTICGCPPPARYRKYIRSRRPL